MPALSKHFGEKPKLDPGHTAVSHGTWPTRSDWHFMFLLPLLAALAWIVPPRFWARLGGKPNLRTTEEFARDFLEYTENTSKNRGRVYFDKPEIMTYLREYSPLGWQPSITLENVETLEAARTAGSGAVLWVADFSRSQLVAKKALCAAGYEMFHLSRPIHGPVESSFGVRWLNWTFQRAETKYLKQRVVIEDGNEVAGLRTLRKALKAGEFVSVTAGRESRNVVWLPFREGRYPFAPGAPLLAAGTGAPLLAVFVLRDPDDFERFRVVIDGPIEAPEGLSREETVRSMMEQYLALHEAYLPLYEPVWDGRRSFRFGPPGA
ncbi:MAG: hypothetical protein AAGJ74_15395 [Pseudomonadota bacterium]